MRVCFSLFCCFGCICFFSWQLNNLVMIWVLGFSFVKCSIWCFRLAICWPYSITTETTIIHVNYNATQVGTYIYAWFFRENIYDIIQRTILQDTSFSEMFCLRIKIFSIKFYPLIISNEKPPKNMKSHFNCSVSPKFLCKGDFMFLVIVPCNFRWVVQICLFVHCQCVYAVATSFAMFFLLSMSLSEL